MGQGDGSPRAVKLSELFEDGKDTLFIYSFMFIPSPDGNPIGSPCPNCTSIIDAVAGQAQHLIQRINLAVSAKAPIEHFRAHAYSRGWAPIRMLSSAASSYNRDYGAEDAEGRQWPIATVFARRDGQILHWWSSELFWASHRQGEESRHVDFMWPYWNILDCTPETRGPAPREHASLGVPVTRRPALILPVGVLLVAGLAWWASVERMQGMDVGPSAALGGLGWFTATWLVMMAAMMLPVIWPAIGGEYAADSTRTLARRQRLAPFATIVVYLGVRTLAGALAYGALRAGRSLAGGTFAWHRGGRWVCVATVAIAAHTSSARSRRGGWPAVTGPPSRRPPRSPAGSGRASALAFAVWGAPGPSWQCCSR